jgi:hypothetical protein
MDYFRKYANEENIRRTTNGGVDEADCGDDDEDSDSSISDFYEG